MSETCPTVFVKADNDEGYKIINESDFDSKVHTKVGVSAEQPVPPTKKTPPPPPVAKKVPPAPPVKK